MKREKRFLSYFDLFSKDRKYYFERLFIHCPKEVMTSAIITEIKRGQHIIKAGGESTYIYILLKGRARGIEYQNSGELYSFIEFGPGALIGDYEVFGEVKSYRIAIRAVTDCQMLSIPADIYVKWMQHDNNALYMRVQDIMRDLTRRLSDERKFLLLNCKDRMILYLTKRFEIQDGHWENGHLLLPMTQKELAECIGVTLRTMQRTIYQMHKAGYISLISGKIIIDEAQYTQMKQYEEIYLND